MRFMQIESVLQTKNQSEPVKNLFSVALIPRDGIFHPHRTLVFDSFSCISLDFEC